MSNKEIVPRDIRDLIAGSKAGFEKVIASTGNSMFFAQESLFAMQAMLSNEVLAKTALNNPVSFKLAMAQVASSGLSLNPSLGLAYLVPREGKVIADVSYRGLIKIATDSRAVNLVVAQSVYSLDGFLYRGENEEPSHQFDPFMARDQRGDFRGVYVKAYLAIGKLLVTAIPADDIYAARELSRAYKKGSGPWITHPHPMNLKTGIKISRKYWPQTSPALDSVISYLNEEGGEGFTPGPITFDVASRELGPQAIGMDPTIAMPTMHVDPRVAMALEPQQFEAPAQVIDQPLSEQIQEEQMPEPAQQATAIQTSGTVVNIDSAALDPKMVTRIENVVSRSVRMKTWKAAEDWIVNHLASDQKARDYALQMLRKAQSEAMVDVA